MGTHTVTSPCSTQVFAFRQERRIHTEPWLPSLMFGAVTLYCLNNVTWACKKAFHLSRRQCVGRLCRQNIIVFGGGGETSDLDKYPRMRFLELLSWLGGAGSRMKLAKLLFPSSEVLILDLFEQGNFNFWRKMLCSGGGGPQQAHSSKREGFCREICASQVWSFIACPIMLLLFFPPYFLP